VHRPLRSLAPPLLGVARVHSDTVGVFALTLASLLVLLLAPVNPGEGVSRHRDALAVVFVLFSTLPLLWRRQAPLAVAAFVVCVSLIGSVRGYALALTTVGALVGLASAAYLTDRRSTVALGAFTLVALIAISSIAGGSLLGLQPLVSDASAPLVALFAGDVMRTRRLYADRWRARAQEIEELRDADQQRAVAQERVRLARDVHDIVGHYLAGIALQARAGLRRVQSNPARTTQALTEIDHLASEALAETRQAVGIIRSADALTDLRPAPGIDDIEDLIGRLRTPDVHIELRRDPPTSALPATLQTAAYRIVQEAVNNVIKHASPATAQVTIEQQPDALTVTVRDDGNTIPTAGRDEHGHGLRGMRERAEQVGGTLQAGPDSSGGWRVQATLPVRDTDLARARGF
jgi:signal transduction histidine kinase